MLSWKNKWLMFTWVFLAGAVLGLLVGLAWPQSAKNPRFFVQNESAVTDNPVNQVLHGEITVIDGSTITVTEKQRSFDATEPIKVKISDQTLLYKTSPKNNAEMLGEEIAQKIESLHKELTGESKKNEAERQEIQKKIEALTDQAQAEQNQKAEALRLKIASLAANSTDRAIAEAELLSLTSPLTYTKINQADLTVGQAVQVTPAGDPQARPLTAQQIIITF